LALSVALPSLVVGQGCEPASGGVVSEDNESLSQINGLSSLNGFCAKNGYRAKNGLELTAGLATEVGLPSTAGLMTTAEGRSSVSYLVRCALPAGRTVVKKDQYGTSYAFSGMIGLAPEWETGKCGPACQEWVTSCMLSLVNTTGQHVPVYLMASAPQIGWGRDPAYPKQEGTFFGNIFLDMPQAYYCAGRDYGSPIDGRIGSNQTDPPYTDIAGPNAPCSAVRCTAGDGPAGKDGWKSCWGWNHPITVWHQ